MSFTRRTFLGVASATSALLATRAMANAVDSVHDPLGVRADFPSIEYITFLDSAYTALSPRQAIEAAKGFIDSIGSNPPNVPEMMQESMVLRERFARLVGAEQADIGLLYATSDGENIVTRALNFQAGDNVVIDDLHYQSTYVLYQRLKQELGIEIRIVRNINGAAPPELFEPMVDDRTRLISVSWISHFNGYRQDLKGLADLAHAHNGYLYVDAIQGIGMLELDVKKADIDFMTSGSYKWLLAGYGVAPFYVRKELMPMVTPDRSGGFQAARSFGDHQYELHTDGRKFQYATMSFGAVYHLNAALEYILGIGVGNIEKHTVGLAHQLQNGLRSQGFVVSTPEGNASSIVAFEHGRDAKDVRKHLQAAGIKINISDGKALLRVGPALYNNQAEIDHFLDMTSGWT
jgi:selenocysteine lyase/cysteine desulfurase